MATTSKYWLSLDQWRKDPQFQTLAEQEFLSSPLKESESGDGWARREFLKLMGASLALTSFGCMRRPAQMIVPYAKKPKEIIHGFANYYASAFVDAGEAFGILVTSRDGRPVKVEGNPDHPLTQGGMSARAHAHLLSLYDPDRLHSAKRHLFNEKKSKYETVTAKYEDLDKIAIDQFKKGGVALLVSSVSSPSTQTLINDFANTYNAKVYTWDALGYDDLVEAQALCYGKGVLPRWRFDQARMIVSVGSDFLGSHYAATVNAASYSRGRRAGRDMNRLVVFESLLSLTGTNADERFRIGSEGELDVLMGLLHELLAVKKLSRFAQDGSVLKTLAPFAGAEQKLGLAQGTLARIAEELWKERGHGIVLAGNWAQSSTSMATQIAANFLNSVLENDGATVEHGSASFVGGQGRNANLAKLIDDLGQGKIKSLIIHGSNPVYSAVSSGFTEAVKKAALVVYTGSHDDETANQADLLVPDHHPLERWDDIETNPGVYTIQQPTIQPLGETRSFQDSLLVWGKGSANASSRMKSAQNWYEYLREHWRSNIYGGHRGLGPAAKNFDDFWMDVLQKGVFDTSGGKGSGGARGFSMSALNRIAGQGARSQGYSLHLYATVGLRDGSLANVSWLQEFPDPVTKICWDNYLTVSPQDAAREKWSEGDLVVLKVADNELEVPVHIQPGQADRVLGLAVGYGRTRAGKIASGVGVNAFSLVAWEKERAVSAGLPASVTKLGRHYELASVQDHHSMEGREIVVEATLAQYLKDPSANLANDGKSVTMWSEHKYPKHKWGMVIDLNVCTGCSACLVACQSENNVPTVGKRYVLKGREMHWLRVDRYYVGEPNDPAVVHQPIVCMHCDTAPCETVCPVMATVHSDEGTNDMIYNRCVGTRYCSNNCPYKVRRFNWFNYVKTIEKPLNYAMNPDVTVRSRGVMEKCTFCLHRIRGVQNKAKLENRELKDGEVVTACQQSCPTGAIVFGDLNNPESKVRKAFDEKNAYALLAELNTKPAVRYRTKIRNCDELKGEEGESHQAHGKGHA